MSSACVSSAGVACGGRRADKQLRWDAAGEIMALNEGFKFHRILGSGAYGMVCEVTDMKKGVKYAVKKCFNIFKSQSVALRTLREIRLLRLMRHDHIVKLENILQLDGGANFNDLYLVLELMETDLSKIIHSGQELSDAHLEYFMAQLISACMYMHASNVIHRDIKPKNLLVNSNCLLKVADFGLARSVNQEYTRTAGRMTDYVTTRWYRAPEILGGWTSYSKAIDMWSVGTVLAELLGRSTILPGVSTSDQLQRIVTLLGCPPPAFTSKCSEKRAAFLRSFDANIGGVYFEDMYPSARRNSIALLEMLLAWDPDSRASAENAATHPYFTKIHKTHAVNFNKEALTDLAGEFEFESLITQDSGILLRNEIIMEARKIRLTKHKDETSRTPPTDVSSPARSCSQADMVDFKNLSTLPPKPISMLKRSLGGCTIV